MAKSLLVAVATFVCLGLYYRSAADEPVAEQAKRLVENPREAARSAALAGINVAKQGLTESWRSELFAGKHRGAKYNAAATVRDDRARVESIGRALGAGEVSESYRLRVEIYRSDTANVDANGAPTYTYRIRPVAI